MAQSNSIGTQRHPSASPNVSTNSKRPIAAGPDATTRARVLDAYGQLPLRFEPNRGQTDEKVKFLSRAPEFTLFLTGNEAVLRLRGSESKVESHKSKGPGNGAASGSRVPAILRMTLTGGNRAPVIAGVEELPGKSNYFIGRDPKKWHAGIPNYRKVATADVYPGIDLVYYGNQRQLEYDFTVAPGADPRTIRLALETGNSRIENGNSKIAIDTNGDLVIGIDGGELRFHKPVVYQAQLTVDSQQLTATDNRQPIDARYVLRAVNPKSKIENPKYEVGFEIASYDRTKPLIIDPVLSYSTYLGGSNIDNANGIAVDSTGSVFVVGETDSTDFPTAHPLQANAGGGPDFPDDAFVTKISSQGTLVYSTYLGGNNREYGTGIAVDTFGNAYVTGTTLSPDFPSTIGAFDPQCGTDGKCNEVNGRLTSDAFVTKLNPEGSALVYSSFLGGAGNERGFGIAVDNNGNAYVTGQTDFTDFPATPNAFDATCGTDGLCNFNPTTGTQPDGVVTKFSASGSSVLYSTYLGGSSEDEGYAIAADNGGNAYITGLTFSTDFPVTANAAQAASAGAGDAFMTVVNTNLAGLASLAYSTYLGGNGLDQGNSITVDGTGRVYVTGLTKSLAVPFPTAGVGIQASCTLNALGGCDGDVFVSKIDPTLLAGTLLLSTYFGGTAADAGTGIALDPAGNIYLTGFTNSNDFPAILATAFQPQYGGGNTDAFVTKLNPTLAAPPNYSSYLGGSSAENGAGIAVDVNGNAYVAGQTCSGDFPTARPLQSTPGGNCDAFVAKVRVGPDIDLSAPSLAFGAQAVATTSLPQTVTITSIGDSALNITSVAISGNFAVQTNTCSGASLTVDQACAIAVTFSPASSGPKTGTLTITDNVAPGTHTVSLTGSGTTLSLSPTGLVFGDQGLGTTSAVQTVTMTNTGASAVTIFGIDTSGAFTQNNTCGNSLAAGASCTINVTFTPATIGILVGAVTITDTDPTSPQVITLTGHGTAAVAAVTPASLSFGNQGGTGPAKTVTLSNSGNAPLAIASITLTGDFTQTNTCGASLVAGASCLISVSFVPHVPGPATGLLTIADSAAGSPRTVSLSGTGVVPAVSLAPAGLTFASQAVTTPRTPSSPQTVVLTNTGTATLNLITAPAVTGVNNTDFTVNDNCFPSVLAGASCAISVTFAPSAAGTRLAAVTITDDAGNSPQTIALSGEGVLGPWATVAPTSLTFADRPVGTTSPAQTVTITNSGSAGLLISSIATTGDFAKSDACGSFIAAGSNCTVSVTFTPTAVGNRYGTLAITDNSSNSPQTVLLAGNGQAVPTVSLVPTAITFGDQIVNTTSNSQTVTLTNVGGADLAITSVTIGGTNGGDFALVGNTCAGTFVPGSAPCSITVTFTPTAAGVRIGSIIIADNAPNTPQTVPLSGNGTLPPGVGLSPTSLTFADQSVGSASAPQTVTLTNTGGGTLNFTSPIIITGANAPDFNVNHNCPGSLAPGLNCTLTVTFTPSASGNRLAAVSIADNAPGSPQSIPLFGGGSSAAGDYTISVDPKTATVFAGSSANFNLTVTPLNGFTGKVTLTCAGAPRQAACVASPASVTLDGNNPSVVDVSIQTTARVQSPPGSGPNSLPPTHGLHWLPWALLLMMLATMAAAGRRRTTILLSVVILMALLWTACGGGGQFGVPNGTPAGTYTLTITGISGSSTKTTTVTLTVN